MKPMTKWNLAYSLVFLPTNFTPSILTPSVSSTLPPAPHLEFVLWFSDFPLIGRKVQISIFCIDDTCYTLRLHLCTSLSLQVTSEETLLFAMWELFKAVNVYNCLMPLIVIQAFLLYNFFFNCLFYHIFCLFWF